MVCSRNHSTLRSLNSWDPLSAVMAALPAIENCRSFGKKHDPSEKMILGVLSSNIRGIATKSHWKRERSLRTSVVYSSKQKCRNLFSCLPLLLDCWVARKCNVICSECGNSFIGERGAAKETVFHGILLATQWTGTTWSIIMCHLIFVVWDDASQTSCFPLWFVA